MHPRWRHAPPSPPRAISTTSRPSCAARIAAGNPPGPPIDEAGVYREAHGPPLANPDPGPVHDRLLRRLPDPQDCNLGRVDDDRLPLPAVTAEVGSRAGFPPHLLR